jgi:hypothetical protein
MTRVAYEEHLEACRARAQEARAAAAKAKEENDAKEAKDAEEDGPHLPLLINHLL